MFSQHSQDKPKKTQLNNVVSWMESWNKKKDTRKNEGNLNNVRTLVNNNISRTPLVTQR